MQQAAGTLPTLEQNEPAEIPTLPNPFRDDQAALPPELAGEFVGGA
jgi:hypothetical protein